MVKRLKAAKLAKTALDIGGAKNIMDSAQSIWLAGLGAFSKAQGGGEKLFETLLEQGKKLEAQTRGVAAKAMSQVKGTAEQAVGSTVQRASGQWDKLEQVFEERVARSLSKLGVVTSKDIQALSEQVASLSDAVAKLGAKPAASSAPKPRAAAKKSAGKKKAPVKKNTGMLDQAMALGKQAGKAVAKQPLAKKTLKAVKKLVR